MFKWFRAFNLLTVLLCSCIVISCTLSPSSLPSSPSALTDQPTTVQPSTESMAATPVITKPIIQDFFPTPQINTSPIESLYFAATSVQELTTLAEIIVIGQIRETDETINAARNPLDISQPHPDIFMLGQIYRVSVERYLKGKGENTLKIIQTEAILSQKQTPITPNNIANAKANHEHIQFGQQHKYILFLKAVKVPEKHYSGVGLVPFAFKIADNGNAEAETLRRETSRAFQAKPASVLIQEIDEYVNGRKPGPIPSPASPVPIATMPSFPTVLPPTPIPTPIRRPYP